MLSCQLNNVKQTEEHLKGRLIPGTLFEELRFNYIGPINGHDRIIELAQALKKMRSLKGQKFLQIMTKRLRLSSLWGNKTLSIAEQHAVTYPAGLLQDGYNTTGYFQRRNSESACTIRFKMCILSKPFFVGYSSRERANRWYRYLRK
ncbi:MAG: 1-deoxy-D-xylulose-5-phosphate synthase N-terminal domain-containing protein [Candidatus Malihini olakiniferum]